MKNPMDRLAAPARSRALDKADVTTREAQKITQEEVAARIAKTARLKAERLAREQADAPAAKETGRERKR